MSESVWWISLLPSGVALSLIVLEALALFRQQKFAGLSVASLFLWVLLMIITIALIYSTLGAVAEDASKPPVNESRMKEILLACVFAGTVLTGGAVLVGPKLKKNLSRLLRLAGLPLAILSFIFSLQVIRATDDFAADDGLSEQLPEEGNFEDQLLDDIMEDPPETPPGGSL